MKRFRVRWAGLVGVGVVAVAAGTAYAAIPSAKGVFTGCVSRTDGSVRVIDPSLTAHCTRSETRVTWNMKGQIGSVGPAGQIGPTGSTGATGASGQTGPAGVSGYQVVSRPGTFTVLANNTSKSQIESVLCPSGKVAMGGGGNGNVTINNVGAGLLNLSDSEPLFDGSGWRVSYAKLDGSFFTTAETGNFTSYVVCVNATK